MPKFEAMPKLNLLRLVQTDLEQLCQHDTRRPYVLQRDQHWSYAVVSYKYVIQLQPRRLRRRLKRCGAQCSWVMHLEMQSETVVRLTVMDPSYRTPPQQFQQELKHPDSLEKIKRWIDDLTRQYVAQLLEVANGRAPGTC